MGIIEIAVVVFALVSVLVVFWPATRICMRMGFSPWLMLLTFVPIGNLVLLWYVAYAPWPREMAPAGTTGGVSRGGRA